MPLIFFTITFRNVHGSTWLRVRFIIIIIICYATLEVNTNHILVCLLCYVLCTSLTWWSNVDVSEIMMFTDDGYFIKILCLRKRHDSRKFICEFLKKNWNCRYLHHLINKVVELLVLSILFSVNLIDINVRRVLILREMCYFSVVRLLHRTVATKRICGWKFLCRVLWHYLEMLCTKYYINWLYLWKLNWKYQWHLFMWTQCIIVIGY